MKRFLGFVTIIFTYLFLIIGVGFAFAEDAPVSATVPASSFNPPTLISPLSNATLNTTRPTFSWLRPSPNPGNLNHYDFILDGSFFANVADSVTTQETATYSVYRSGDTFYLTLKTDLSQGYHTWSVTAYNDGGISSASETRTFYVDSIPPFISVTRVDNQSLNWTTADASTIPPVQDRYLIVTTASPLIRGSVEQYANLQATLVCPSGLSGCSDQNFTGNIASGNWETTFTNLVPNQTYTVRISATDAASNSTVFPEFYITYSVAEPAPTATVTPTPTVTVTPTVTGIPTPTVTTEPTLPLPSITATPPPGELVVITPTPFIPAVPPAPTPPPAVTRPSAALTIDLFYLFLLILFIFGLLLHLLMAIIGTGTPLNFVPKFLWILAFPFFHRRKYQTIPFAFIDFFIADKLDKPWQSVVSDIKGFYNLKSPIPPNLFIHLTAIDRIWKDNLYKGSLIPITCLYPIPVRPIELKRLQKTLYDWRIIPLIIALLSSITALVIKPSYETLSYVLTASLYLFSEYLYPRL